MSLKIKSEFSLIPEMDQWNILYSIVSANMISFILTIARFIIRMNNLVVVEYIDSYKTVVFEQNRHRKFLI